MYDRILYVTFWLKSQKGKVSVRVEYSINLFPHPQPSEVSFDDGYCVRHCAVGSGTGLIALRGERPSGLLPSLFWARFPGGLTHLRKILAGLPIEGSGSPYGVSQGNLLLRMVLRTSSRSEFPTSDVVKLLPFNYVIHVSRLEAWACDLYIK